LTFTEVELVSIAIVGNIPTSGLEDSKRELGHLHLHDETGGHDLGTELSSLEVGTVGTRTTSVFHVGTLQSRATVVLSESTGNRFSVNDSGSVTSKGGRLDVAGESSAAGSKPLRI